MGWDDLIKSLGDEVSTITHAPLAFLLVVLVAAGPIFALARWRFSVRLEHLETRLKLREDEIAALKNPAESILAGVGQSRRSDEFRLKGRRTHPWHWRFNICQGRSGQRITRRAPP